VTDGLYDSSILPVCAFTPTSEDDSLLLDFTRKVIGIPLEQCSSRFEALSAKRMGITPRALCSHVMTLLGELRDTLLTEGVMARFAVAVRGTTAAFSSYSSYSSYSSAAATGDPRLRHDNVWHLLERVVPPTRLVRRCKSTMG